MRRKLNRPAVWLAAALTLLCVVTIAVLILRAQARPEHQALTVMTRNLYIGADITRPLRAAEGRNGQEAILALGHANHELRKIVERTNFGVRSKLLAEEIAAAQPDLVGLQELALWRHGEMQLDQLGKPNATEVDYDFLATLLADLSQRGAGYEVLKIQEESDVEAPAFTGNPYAGTVRDTQDVRLTVRDVILLRRGSGIQVADRGGAHYRQELPVDLAGMPFSFVRGYAWVEVTKGNYGLRFVSTHLESQNGEVAAAQADELLQALAGLATQTTVIACDCNADPESSGGARGEVVAPLTTYQILTNTDRFADLWLQQPESAGTGYTSGLGELVNDPTPDGFTRRLDLVLARPAKGTDLTVSNGDVTGDELADRELRTGLWPSDHAGLALNLGLS
jgi:endonuclease/exonuclease/phosphatase family metal-dependent hydrolase